MTLKTDISTCIALQPCIFFTHIQYHAFSLHAKWSEGAICCVY